MCGFVKKIVTNIEKNQYGKERRKSSKYRIIVKKKREQIRKIARKETKDYEQKKCGQ